MTFDRSAKLNVSQAVNASSLKQQLGSVGLKNGPRASSTHAFRRSTESNEAYVCRRFILSRLNELQYPLSIKHIDAPDFEINENGYKYGLEVCEISPPEDGYIFSQMNEGDVQPIGDYSVTGTTKAILDGINQTQSAISKKDAKAASWSLPTNLILYPNSNAWMWVSLCNETSTILSTSFEFTNLRNVFLLLDDQEIHTLKQKTSKEE